MKRYQQLHSLFLKYTPQTNKAHTAELYERMKPENMTTKQVDPIFRYMESLLIHRQYLQFFQIGVVRNQKSKMQKTAKYVGLAMPKILQNLRLVQKQVRDPNSEEQKNKGTPNYQKKINQKIRDD